MVCSSHSLICGAGSCSQAQNAVCNVPPRELAQPCNYLLPAPPTAGSQLGTASRTWAPAKGWKLPILQGHFPASLAFSNFFSPNIPSIALSKSRFFFFLVYQKEEELTRLIADLDALLILIGDFVTQKKILCSLRGDTFIFLQQIF